MTATATETRKIWNVQVVTATMTQFKNGQTETPVKGFEYPHPGYMKFMGHNWIAVQNESLSYDDGNVLQVGSRVFADRKGLEALGMQYADLRTVKMGRVTYSEITGESLLQALDRASRTVNDTRVQGRLIRERQLIEWLFEQMA